MRTRAWKCLAFLIALSSSTVAYAIEAPKRPPPSEASRSYSIADLPEAIRVDFIGRVGAPIAAPGEDINPTDANPPAQRA
jgi:hypothetical protein